MTRLRQLRQGGFTIIELMIATAVLSTILVLVTVVMVNIGQLYYKGLNQARVQDNVRGISDEMAQHLKLGEKFFHVSNGAEQAYCIGNLRYTYVLYRQIGSDSAQRQSPHVLWRDNNPTPDNCSTALPNLNSGTPSASGTELIAPNSRLTSLVISGNSPYNLSVGVAYGDNDLLCDTGVAGNCASSQGLGALLTSPSYTPGGVIRCRGNIGDQYCAAARLQSTVVRRLP